MLTYGLASRQSLRLVLMDVSEHLQRELTYQLNAALLRTRGELSASQVTQTMVDVIRTHGPAFHEPDLMGAWSRELDVESDELELEIEQAVEIILEELRDDEAPWSAHRVLDLLAQEPFWVLEWGAPGEPLPAPLLPGGGLPLPLALRGPMLTILDALELRLFNAYQDQRSVHDELPPGLMEEALDEAMEGFRALGERYSRRGEPSRLDFALQPSAHLPPLREALHTIQRWKLTVEFEAAPDDDDGEWTLRVIERLYGLVWML